MGSKSSKPNPINAEPLSRQMIEELCQDTGFTEEELLAWHTNFYKDCPDGKLTLKQFEQAYAKIMGKPTQKTADYVRHMFSVYDHDKNQFIDFKEFVMALSAASVVNRLRLIETLFHVFDLDNDGKITKEEIGKMLHSLVDVTNSNNKQRRHHHHHQSNQPENTKQIDVQKRIDDAFNELNANDDDHITKDEFIEWYMKSGLISDVQTNEINLADTSRIQNFGKKTRKLTKQSSHIKSNNEHEENHPRLTHLVRHMSRMTEKKPLTRDVDENDDNNHPHPTTISSSLHVINDDDIDDDDDEQTFNKPSLHITNMSDTDSHYSKENERWQHLFNSVLGQIRAQRNKEQQMNINEQNNKTNFSSWKREGEEKLKAEYVKQRSNKLDIIQPQITNSNEPPPSPEIITIRF